MLFELVYSWESYHKNKKGELLLRHSVKGLSRAFCCIVTARNNELKGEVIARKSK